MSVLVDVVNAIVDFNQQVSDFIHHGIYDFVVKATAYYVKWAVVAWFKIKLAGLLFSYDVAKEILDSLNVSQTITAAYSSLDSRVVQALAFFRIPEALNIILSAAATRFVFNFLGF